MSAQAASARLSYCQDHASILLGRPRTLGWRRLRVTYLAPPPAVGGGAILTQAVLVSQNGPGRADHINRYGALVDRFLGLRHDQGNQPGSSRAWQPGTLAIWPTLGRSRAAAGAGFSRDYGALPGSSGPNEICLSVSGSGSMGVHTLPKTRSGSPASAGPDGFAHQGTIFLDGRWEDSAFGTLPWTAGTRGSAGCTGPQKPGVHVHG